MILYIISITLARKSLNFVVDIFNDIEQNVTTNIQSSNLQIFYCSTEPILQLLQKMFFFEKGFTKIDMDINNTIRFLYPVSSF